MEGLQAQGPRCWLLVHVSLDWFILREALTVGLCKAEAEVRMHVSMQTMLYAGCEHAANFAVACTQHSPCLM